MAGARHAKSHAQKKPARDLHRQASSSQRVTLSSMPAWLHRLTLALSALVALGVIGGLAVVLAQTRAEYAQVRQLEIRTRQRLAEVETKLAEQELVLERLRSDPAYVERVIRRRLGYAKPDEFVFRFEE